MVTLVWVKRRRGYFRFPDFWSTLVNENCHNSRTSNDIDMKLGPVTKFDKGNTTPLKKLPMTSCQKIVMSLSIFQVKADFEHSGRRISHVWSVKLLFSLTVTFYHTKTENRTKKSPTQLPYCWRFFSSVFSFYKIKSYC